MRNRAGVVVCAVALWLLAGPLAAQVRASDEYLDRMDGDGDGVVSLAEYQQWMGYAFTRMDRDGDGVLAPHELPGGRGQAITLDAHRLSLERAFQRQDLDGDGVLDARELSAPPAR